MYVASDPRSKLTVSGPAKAAQDIGVATHARFYETEPVLAAPGVRSWYTRAQNFVVVLSDVEAGAELVRENQPDEFTLLLPDPAARAAIKWDGITTELSGHSITFVPPGRSRIVVANKTRLVQFFTKQSEDLVALASGSYNPDPNVPPLEPWPEPKDGFRVRHYSMNIPPAEGRLGRIFRSTNFMVNYIYPRTGPRDRSKMSPHSHADFQQCSLCLEGEYVHHLRWPWGNDADRWREDEHAVLGAPSVTIIPAQVIHTSESVGKGTNMLVDVFCPPRLDFSRQPGWVLNADEYPEPPAQ